MFSKPSVGTGFISVSLNWMYKVASRSLSRLAFKQKRGPGFKYASNLPGSLLREQKPVKEEADVSSAIKRRPDREETPRFRPEEPLHRQLPLLSPCSLSRPRPEDKLRKKRKLFDDDEDEEDVGMRKKVCVAPKWPPCVLIVAALIGFIYPYFFFFCFSTGKTRWAIFVQISASDQEGGGWWWQVWGRERQRKRTSIPHCCREKRALWWHGTMQWWLQERTPQSVYQNTSRGQWPVSLQLSTGRPQQWGRQWDPGKRLSPQSSPQAPPASQGAKPRAEQSTESGHPEVGRLPRHREPPADQGRARDGERGTQKVFP